MRALEGDAHAEHHAALPATASRLSVELKDRSGTAVADAVVTLLRRDGAGPRVTAGATHAIDQKELTFRPYVEVLRPGDAAVFRNSDATRHHVYSFSPVKQFEYVIAPHTAAPAVTLPRNDVVAVGCNIHDGMISYLYVTDAPWVVRTGADGRAEFPDLPRAATPCACGTRACRPRSPTWCRTT